MMRNIRGIQTRLHGSISQLIANDTVFDGASLQAHIGLSFIIPMIQY